MKNTIKISSKSLTSASRRKVWLRMRNNAERHAGMGQYIMSCACWKEGEERSEMEREAQDIGREADVLYALADAFCPKKKIRAR